jgi:hypothetical protein
MVTRENSNPAGAEKRLKELGIELPAPPEPFGIYAEAVQTGNLLFLTGMLPTEGRAAKFVGRIGAELDVEAGRKAAHLAALNALAVARQHLGSLASSEKTRTLAAWFMALPVFHSERRSSWKSFSRWRHEKKANGVVSKHSKEVEQLRR